VSTRTQTRTVAQRAASEPRSARFALYLRLSVADGEDGDSAGIDRQRDDTLALARRRGADGGSVVRLHTDVDADTADVVVYVEDGESTFKRRKVTITDHYGERRTAWRVVRPVWAAMMRDLRAGKIGSAIVYNSDRLARDPYDTEDVIESARDYGVMWDAATGSLDLRTDDGRTMLRIMMAVPGRARVRVIPPPSAASVRSPVAPGENANRCRPGYPIPPHLPASSPVSANEVIGPTP